MFNSKEVASMVGVADSTLRRYIKIFPQAFTKNAKRPRNRRYTEQDLAVVARVKDLFAEGYKEEDIRTQLASIIEDNPPPPEFTSSLAIIPKMDKAIRDTRKDVRDTRKTVEDMASRLDRIEREWREFQRLPWYRKLFRRRPPSPFEH